MFTYSVHLITEYNCPMYTYPESMNDSIMTVGSISLI